MGGYRKDKRRNLTERINKLNDILMKQGDIQDFSWKKIDEIIETMVEAKENKKLSYTKISQITGLGRESLYKMIPLNKKKPFRQNPTILSLVLIAHTCDLELKLVPKDINE